MAEKLGRRGNMVAHNVSDMKGNSLGLHWWFWCPGCDELHAYTTPRWTRTGTDDAPTFQPSLLVTYGKTSNKRCHLFLRDGKLRFLGDCTHKLAATTVPIPEPPDWLIDEGEQHP